MYRPGQFVAQNLIDLPLPVDAGTLPEGFGDDLDAEVRLTLGPGTDMTGVKVGFIDDRQPAGRKRLGELAFNGFGHGHLGVGSDLELLGFQ